MATQPRLQPLPIISTNNVGEATESVLVSVIGWTILGCIAWFIFYCVKAILDIIFSYEEAMMMDVDAYLRQKKAEEEGYELLCKWFWAFFSWY